MVREHDSLIAYSEPFLWWGPVWEPPPVRSLVELIRDGVLTPTLAALLWGMLSRRASVVVAAGPRGVGKTTLLSALLDCYPATSRRLYLRGCYESFAFLDDPLVDPGHGLLLVNEISSHLPAYLWGPGVRRLFQAAGQGFSFAATAHAASVEELVGQLASYPLRVPMSELAAINLVVLMASAEPATDRWRVEQVWTLTQQGPAGLTVAALAERGELLPAADNRATDAALIPPAAEIERRAELLAGLAATSTTVEQVRQAMARFAG
jgi:hypothetical protein